MSHHAEQPLIYEAYAHTWLGEWKRRRQQMLTLAEIPDEEIERLARLRVDWLWLMGAWQTGLRGLEIARGHPSLREEYLRLLGPGFSPEDVVGSPYAIANYQVHEALGGPDALAALRLRLAQRGIKLMLDFVPNHSATDHPWTRNHPGYYVAGSSPDLAAGHAFSCNTSSGARAIICHGRDPYFPPWSDTAQLDWRNPETVAALTATMLDIAEQCDGVRCDMAMLVLRDVFASTWGADQTTTVAAPAGPEPWRQLIEAVRARHRDFAFAAEAYWGLEPRLLSLGFTWAYDKTLYDRLLHGDAWSLREHLRLEPRTQRQYLRFLENHDEPRAASALPRARHEAAAVLCATVPGAFLVHHGQLAGLSHKTPIQLGRLPDEPGDAKLAAFYERLLAALRHGALRGGGWEGLACRPAWEGNPTSDGFLAHAWSSGEGLALLVAVNFQDTRGQCYVDLRGAQLPDSGQIVLRDELSGERYERDCGELRSRGLYVDLPAWGSHLLLREAASPRG